MDLKYKYIELHTAFFVLLLWNRTWSKLNVKFQKIIKKILLSKLLLPVVLYLKNLKQAWGAQIAARSSLGVDGCGQQLRIAWGWACWDASGYPWWLRTLSPAGQEQGRELEWGSAVPAPRRTSRFVQWRPTQPCRAWQPLLVPDTFFYTAKVKWSVVVLCPKGWCLVSGLLFC